MQKVASYDEFAQCLRARTPGNIDNSSTTVVQHPVITMAHGQGGAEIGFGRGPTLTCNHEAPIAVYPAVAFNARQDPDHWHDRTGPLDTDGGTQAVSYAIQAGALRTNPASGPDGVGVQADHAYTLEARAEVQAVAVSLRGREGGATAELGDEVQNCLRASSGGGDKPHVLTAMQVRRITPTEAERLMGFPDNYTAIPWRGKPADQCPDGPRYRALGNSWAVPNVRWIGERIQRECTRLNLDQTQQPRD